MGLGGRWNNRLLRAQQFKHQAGTAVIFEPMAVTNGEDGNNRNGEEDTRHASQHVTAQNGQDDPQGDADGYRGPGRDGPGRDTS